MKNSTETDVLYCPQWNIQLKWTSCTVRNTDLQTNVVKFCKMSEQEDWAYHALLKGDAYDGIFRVGRNN